jgi:hypothetical protein
MILTEVEINIEDAFDNLSSKQEDFAEYVFDNLSEDDRKIFLSYIEANYPDLIQFIKEH